eukprot:7376029-Prymnesium_polylepis.1
MENKNKIKKECKLTYPNQVHTQIRFIPNQVQQSIPSRSRHPPCSMCHVADGDRAGNVAAVRGKRAELLLLLLLSCGARVRGLREIFQNSTLVESSVKLS